MSRTRYPWREADVCWEETGMSTSRSWRGTGPSTYAKIAEITSGSTNFQQGLAATCKDPPYRERLLSWQEDFGGAHEPIGAMKAWVTPAEAVLDTAAVQVTPAQRKGALGKWRALSSLGHHLDSEPGSGVEFKGCRAGGITTHPRGACGRALKLRGGWEGPLGKAAAANRTREIRPSGLSPAARRTSTRRAVLRDSRTRGNYKAKPNQSVSMSPPG